MKPKSLRAICNRTTKISPIASKPGMGMFGPPTEDEQGSSRDEAKRLAAEVSLLSEMQYEALLKSSYALMSKAEREAYDRRRQRIAQLCGSLTRSRPREADAAD
jgi:hypothetical protein